jgi:1-pyrroline-5-carboxylate dehydrogenase
MTEFENEFTWGKAIAENTVEEFHEKFEKAVDEAKKGFGKKYPLIINGKEIYSENTFSLNSPSDKQIIIGEFSKATISNTNDAISSAKNAFARWSSTSYLKRSEIFRECADYFSSRKFFFAAIMSFENGKNRFEAMGDIDEAIDLMRFYAFQLEKKNGFCKNTYHTKPQEKNKAVMKHYVVCGIIEPYNVK